jgi:hypothetical protein
MPLFVKNRKKIALPLVQGKPNPHGAVQNVVYLLLLTDDEHWKNEHAKKSNVCWDSITYQVLDRSALLTIVI